MSNEQTIAIVLLTHNNFVETKYCIDAIKANTEIAYRFHIFDYCSDDKALIEYLTEVCKENKGYFKSISATTESRANVYNMMLETIYEKYAVFLPVNFVVNKGWLSSLRYYYENIKNSGCVAITDSFDNLQLMSMLFENNKKAEDEMRLVYTNLQGVLKEMIFFETERAKKNKFDIHLNCRGYEIYEFCFRFMLEGYTNYYIPKQVVVKLKLDDDFHCHKATEEEKSKLLEHLNILVTKHRKKFHPLTYTE